MIELLLEFILKQQKCKYKFSELKNVSLEAKFSVIVRLQIFPFRKYQKSYKYFYIQPNARPYYKPNYKFLR